MRYSFVAATLVSAALAAISPVNQIPDGQLQVPNSVSSAAAASVTPAAVQTKTAYSTNVITVTSCGPQVVSCPARTYTTSYPIVSSSVPASPASSAPAVPVVPAAPVSSAPAVPVVPAAPVSSAPAAGASTCPPPAVVTVTVTVSGTPAASAPSAPAVPAVPASPASPAGGAAGSPAPAAPASPASPAGGAAGSPVPAAPASPASPAGGAAGSPASPVVPGSPAGTAGSTASASASGGASGSNISPPITPYTGSGAATIGASFGVAGLAAMAAVFLA